MPYFFESERGEGRAFASAAVVAAASQTGTTTPLYADASVIPAELIMLMAARCPQLNERLTSATTSPPRSLYPCVLGNSPEFWLNIRRCERPAESPPRRRLQAHRQGEARADRGVRIGAASRPGCDASRILGGRGFGRAGDLPRHSPNTMATYIVRMVTSRPVLERRHSVGPPAAPSDWLALRRTADMPLDSTLHEVADGLARLDRRLADIGAVLKNATRANEAPITAPPRGIKKKWRTRHDSNV